MFFGSVRSISAAAKAAGPSPMSLDTDGIAGLVNGSPRKVMLENQFLPKCVVFRPSLITICLDKPGLFLVATASSKPTQVC